MKAFERQILHFDGDSFFASVEQMMDYRLRGKPLVTGGERGAITSASIEAKRLGINRGIPMRMAKEICPELVIVPGDYPTYSIFAYRMYAIVREFAQHVEEYSIDECFADITGLDKKLNKSYEEIALMIKEKLETSLGVTFGAGLAPTKVLAKVASKHRKPGGFTKITQENLMTFLETLPTGKVWGIGPASSIALGKMGIVTALELVEKPLSWLQARKVGKSIEEKWYELQGMSVHAVSLEHDAPKSIIKSRTFTPPSTNKSFIFSQLSKNIELACARARASGLAPREVRFYLKTQAFTYDGLDLKLALATSSPIEILRIVEKHFDQVYRKNVLYRATGVSLKQFVYGTYTPDLFGGSAQVEKERQIFKTVDSLSRRFGENTLHLASSLKAHKYKGTLPGKRLDLPFLGEAR